MKSLLVIALAAVGLSIVWNKRADLQRLVETPPPPPKAIQFDNGTVRQTNPASAPAAGSSTSSFQPGVLRKCLKGREVQYTNIGCPPGFKEAAVAGPPVTVVSSDTPRPAAAASQAGGRARLESALGLSADKGLKDRILQRSIEKAP